ncbi:ankyrin repeat domain-containing protein [Flavobacterium tyrosinilyticum]|uniref:ankyrin repeat domain-containing protein n=1 Tax=Flavobacterium tyrosinilyticum TaxID=1658740 RepID=UPI00202DBE98|nr:ankyrin repeat domain-containing protein [Flavobacterium tyrosinilyticum]MCM0665558.1 ankyrin repeat domain-containing protein [Flavobacterium tyrosinilyticum]
MAKKKKTLPKNFSELIEKKDIEALKAVFDTCELDARGGYGKTTALSFWGIPNELIIWLVENGADLEAVDTYNRTALHQNAMIRTGKISTLLELGANIHARDNYGDTPLHFATGSGFNVDAVQKLIEYGADTNALNTYKQTPLERALVRANNIDLKNLAEISKILLKSDVEITQSMKNAVVRRGEDFEFHRENFNKDYLEETDHALKQLYEMFHVPPVKRRILHDGVSPISVTGTTWEKQFEELWELLIPSKGSSKTVQGEVVRISGKVRDEIYRNGGGNWNIDFKKMLDAFFIHLSSNNSLSDNELEKADLIIKYVRKNGDAEIDELNFLCELATKWVLANTTPILLSEPNYKR